MDLTRDDLSCWGAGSEPQCSTCGTVSRRLHTWAVLKHARVVFSTEPPVAEVTCRIQYKSLATLVCRVYGFYPKEVNVTWRKDGEVWKKNTSWAGVLPNSDGTYHTWLSIEVDPEEKRDHYRCYVEHAGLPEPLIVAWEEPGERKEERRGYLLNLSKPVMPLLESDSEGEEEQLTGSGNVAVEENWGRAQTGWGIQRKTQAHSVFILGHARRNGEGSNMSCVIHGGGKGLDPLHWLQLGKQDIKGVSTQHLAGSKACIIFVCHLLSGF